MTFTTIYVKTVKRRKTGYVETIGCAYTTKSETTMHAHIRKTYPDAQTWRDVRDVITNLTPGINLGCMPLLRGGTRIA